MRGTLMPVDKYGVACSAQNALTPGKCFGGAARRAAYINKIRASHDNVLLMDCGGSFFGSLFWQVLQTEPTCWYMNDMEYDVAMLTHFEFHGKATSVASYIQGLDTTTKVVLSNANISAEPAFSARRPNNEPMIVPWAVKIVGGKKVGFLTLIPYSSKKK
jgi:5'-nucleotidase